MEYNWKFTQRKKFVVFLPRILLILLDNDNTVPKRGGKE